MMRQPAPRVVAIIRSLIDRIEVHPDHKRGKCKVVLVGALAQILSFAQQTTATKSLTKVGTFLMVAEEGFEPPTHGL